MAAQRDAGTVLQHSIRRGCARGVGRSCNTKATARIRMGEHVEGTAATSAVRKAILSFFLLLQAIMLRPIFRGGPGFDPVGAVTRGDGE